MEAAAAESVDAAPDAARAAAADPAHAAEDPSPATLFRFLAGAPDDALPAAAAGRLAEATGTAGTQAAVVARPLADPVARLLVAWSLASGGALVLEPHAAAHVATAAWVRPTLFAGSAGEISRLAAEAATHERSYAAGFGRRLLALLGRRAAPPRPFDRLRVLVEVGPPEGGTGSGDGCTGDGFWSERGVARFTAAELLS